MAQSNRQSGSRKSSSKSTGRAASKSRRGRAASKSSGARAASKSSASRRSQRASSGTRRRRRSTPQKTSPVKQVTTAIGNATRKVGGPVVAGGAAIAVAGGALLTRQLTRKRGGGVDFKPVAKGISTAGERVANASQQLSKLSGDVEQVGKSTKKLGDSLS